VSFAGSGQPSEEAKMSPHLIASARDECQEAPGAKGGVFMRVFAARCPQASLDAKGSLQSSDHCSQAQHGSVFVPTAKFCVEQVSILSS